MWLCGLAIGQVGWPCGQAGTRPALTQLAQAERVFPRQAQRLFPCGVGVQWVTGCRPSLHMGGELQREGWWGAPGSAHLGPQSPRPGPPGSLCAWHPSVPQVLAPGFCCSGLLTEPLRATVVIACCVIFASQQPPLLLLASVPHVCANLCAVYTAQRAGPQKHPW